MITTIDLDRWGILWRRFRFAYRDWAKTVLALMKLHNFLMDRKEIESVPLFWEDREGEASPVNLGGGDLLNGEELPRPNATRRQAMTKTLEEMGVGRPIHAALY